MHSVLDPSLQEEYWVAWACLNKRNKVPGDGTRKQDICGAAEDGANEAEGKQTSRSTTTWKEIVSEENASLFLGDKWWDAKQWSHIPQGGGFRLDISQNFLMDMVNRHLNGLPRVIAMSSSLEILNWYMDEDLETWVSGRLEC